MTNPEIFAPKSKMLKVWKVVWVLINLCTLEIYFCWDWSWSHVKLKIIWGSSVQGWVCIWTQKNDIYVRKLILDEIWSPGDLEPLLGMKSRQEFKFELENLPGSLKFQKFWKKRKLSWMHSLVNFSTFEINFRSGFASPSAFMICYVSRITNSYLIIIELKEWCLS